MCYPIVADNTFIEQPVHDTNVYTTDAVSSDSEDTEKLITLGKNTWKRQNFKDGWLINII